MNVSPEQNSRDLIRAMQNGNLNGIDPSMCGPYADIMTEFVRAFNDGGLGAAMRVIAVEPELIQWASEVHHHTPSAFAKPERWLDSTTVLRALGRAEVGDAELLLRLYQNRLVYDHAERAWYFWNGYHWQSDRRRQVWNLVPNTLAAQYLHAAATRSQNTSTDNSDSDTQAIVEKLLKRANSLRYRNRIKNVLDHASKLPDFALAGDEWEPNSMLLAVANGVIDLHSGNFRPGRPEDLIRSASTVGWTGINTPAPRWQQFLQEIFANDVELMDFVQRLFGYAITGTVSEHILPIFWGQGRNGKETLLETLKYVLGDLASPVSRDVVVDSRRDPGAATPHLYVLRSLRLAWVSESRAGAWLNAEQIKWITGGGTITARRLHSNPITFTPRHTLLLITNHVPRADPDDYALWKRLLLIPFTQSFVDTPKAANEHPVDHSLPETLRSEASGILAWLVRGCLEWQNAGLKPPNQVRLATQDYHRDEDDIALFIEKNCVINDTVEVRAGKLYQAYQRWAEECGIKPASQTKFGRRLGKQFDRRVSAGIIYRGIGLLCDAESTQ